MAESHDQAKPLTPYAIFQLRSDEEESITISNFKSRQRNCLKIIGCCTALFLILAVTILVLFFTIFHVKEPVIKMNEANLSPLKLQNNGSLQTGTNVTFLADVSVKNPNFGSFKFKNCTTTFFHGGNVVAEAMTPAGVAKARRTVHLNVTVKLIPEKINAVGDLSSGSLSINTSTLIGGKVKILKTVKKYLTVKLNCNITYTFRSQEIHKNCNPHFN